MTQHSICAVHEKVRSYICRLNQQAKIEECVLDYKHLTADSIQKKAILTHHKLTLLANRPPKISYLLNVAMFLRVFFGSFTVNDATNITYQNNIEGN